MRDHAVDDRHSHPQTAIQQHDVGTGCWCEVSSLRFTQESCRRGGHCLHGGPRGSGLAGEGADACIEPDDAAGQRPIGQPSLTVVHLDIPGSEPVRPVGQPERGDGVADECHPAPPEPRDEANDERIEVVIVDDEAERHALIGQERPRRTGRAMRQLRHRIEQVGRHPGAGVDSPSHSDGVGVGMTGTPALPPSCSGTVCWPPPDARAD